MAFRCALAFNVPYAFGGRLTWETPHPGLRLGGTFLQLHLDTLVFIPMMMEPVGIENDSYTWLASLEYGFGAMTLIGRVRPGPQRPAQRASRKRPWR